MAFDVDKYDYIPTSYYWETKEEGILRRAKEREEAVKKATGVYDNKNVPEQKGKVKTNNKINDKTKKVIKEAGKEIAKEVVIFTVKKLIGL